MARPATMHVDRDLHWDGAYNARDLGGLRTLSGDTVRRGAVVRSATPAFLSTSGWSAVYDYGIRTIIDLTNADERRPDQARRPDELSTVAIPLESVVDREFWDYWGHGLHATPLYYAPFLDRFAAGVGEVIAAIASAQPGGVLVHCGAGRDRTGLVSLVLLAFAGVAAGDIAADHELSHARLRPMFARLGMDDQQPMIDALLRDQHTTAARALVSTVDSLDVDAVLRAAGLSEADLANLRTRLLGGESTQGQVL